MKRFLNIPLNHKISIYVPGTKDVNKETDNGEQVKKIIGVLSDMFGGATAGEHLGGWRSNSGEIVTEKITIVYAFCNEESLKKQHSKRFERLPEAKKRAFAGGYFFRNRQQTLFYLIL